MNKISDYEKSNTMCGISCVIISNKPIETDRLFFIARTLDHPAPDYKGLLFFGTFKNITSSCHYDETIEIGITPKGKTVYCSYILIVSRVVNAGPYFILVSAVSYYGAVIITIIL